MITNTSKNTLIFVHITTHFKEMIRVARLLKNDTNYNPIVFFVTKYEGWKIDFSQCTQEGIECITFFDTDFVQPKIKPTLKKRAFYLLLIRPFRFFLRVIRSRFVSTFFSLIYNTLKKIIKVVTLFQLFERKVLNRLKEIPKLKEFYRHYRSKYDWYKNAIVRRLGKRNKVNGHVKKNIIKLYIYSKVEIVISIFNPPTCSKLLLKLYQRAWKKGPHLLPTFSKIAYEFNHSIPSLLIEKDIKLIVLPEHNLFYFTQLLAFIAKKYNIPSIIVPFTIANTMEWSEAFYDEPSRSLKSPVNRLFAHAFPHWVNEYKERILFLPVELVLIHEMLGITPTHPWLLNSGNIDFLAAESEAMSNYYIAAGIEKERIRTTGALYNDELFGRLNNADEHRATLYQSLKLQSDKPILLCALPPNQFHGRESLIDFADYEESTRFIMSELAQYAEQYHIIINLHPRIKFSTVDFIKEYPVHLYSGDIAEIIPFSSIYVATCSATIRMAATCGIPVINYDLYQYHYDDYKDLDGVLTIFTRSAFCKTLNDLVTKSDYYDYVHNIQKTQSERWGKLDGKAGQNLLNEIDLLFAESS